MPPFPPNFPPMHLGPSQIFGPSPPGPNLGAQHNNTLPPPPLPFRPAVARDLPFIPFIPEMHTPQPPQEPKKWILPEGRGAGVRQRVEEKEQQLGLRCFDPSCGFGPTDESPLIIGEKKERISINKQGTSLERACGHAFHTGCIVSAARVAGFGPAGPAEGDVEVPCIVCRTHGYVEKDAWEEGVRQLQINDV